MDTAIPVSIAIALAGLLCLMIGFTNRGRSYGPLVMWAGIMAMLAVIVHHILATLR